jgi:hypothetical protein
VPVALVALWFGWQYMPDYRSPTLRPLDWRGLLLFSGGSALLSWLLEIFGEHGLSAGQALLPLLLALALLGGYGWHARRVPYPLLSLAPFRIRTFRVSVLGGFVTRLVLVANTVFVAVTIALFAQVGPSTPLAAIRAHRWRPRSRARCSRCR